MSMTAMTNKLVSIYLPTHNRSSLLKRAISSVLEQTYDNLELIICDDCSSDDTWNVIKNFMEQDKRVIGLRNEVPMGACISRNKCIERATGEYITGLDDDDYFLTDRIEILIDCIRTKQVSLVCSNLIYKYKDKDLVGERYSGMINKNDIGYRNIVGNQIFALTSLFKKVNGFDVNAPAWQDYDLWFRLINSYGPCYRVKTPTYVMDISHDLERITTSSKAYQGYKYFLQKHKSNLKWSQINNLYLEDLKNRGDEVRISDVVAHLNCYGVISYTKYLLKEKIPILRRFIENIKMKKI